MESTNEMFILFSILTVIAIIAAPFLAIWANEKINKRKKATNRKLEIFRDLMATRAMGLSPKHVEALNRIEVEFYGVNEVNEAWKEYHDHLGSAKEIDAKNIVGWESWSSKKQDFLINLLAQMATHLNYKFDNVQIKRGHYYPKGYDDIEEDQTIIRQGMVALFRGEKPLPVFSIMPEQQFNALIGLQNKALPEPETDESR